MDVFITVMNSSMNRMQRIETDVWYIKANIICVLKNKAGSIKNVQLSVSFISTVKSWITRLCILVEMVKCMRWESFPIPTLLLLLTVRRTER